MCGKDGGECVGRTAESVWEGRWKGGEKGTAETVVGRTAERRWKGGEKDGVAMVTAQAVWRGGAARRCGKAVR